MRSILFCFVLLVPTTGWPSGGYLARYCADCHAEGGDEGGFTLESLGGEIGDADLRDESTFALWERVFDRIELGEMPPSDAQQPSDEEKNRFLEQLKSPLSIAHQQRGSTVLRRLNRQEYQNTINDLFGTHLDLVSRLPEDGRSHEFENVGDALNLSSVQLEAYLQVADDVLDAAIETRTTRPESKLIRASYADTRGVEKFLGKQWLKLPDGAVVFYQRFGYPTGMLREASAPASGWYDIRVTGYAHQSDRPITMSIGSSTFAQGAEKAHYGFFSLPPGPPTTVTVRAWMDRRYMVEVTPWGIFDPDFLIKKNGIENYRGPGLAISHIELEGPIVERFPSTGHALLFADLKRVEKMPRNPRDREKSWYQPQFEITETDDIDGLIDKTLLRVGSTLFRRPVQLSELTAFRQLFDAERNEGERIESALRTAVAAMMCSSDFLFFRESGEWLDDHAIANRLSYFLTRTLPDEPLRQAAASGQLSKNPQVLVAHTERLLADPRFSRLVNDFADSWLGLRDIDFTAPDGKLFPEFDLYLKHSMLEETRSFLAHLIQNDERIGNLIRSDFAMLNERLARHYGIAGVDGPEIRQVKLPPESLRGGLMSQAAILKITANGTNTSPVVRGIWVNERLLGNHPQPPPPGVPGVEPDIRGALTLREQLDKHRDLDSCRACHRMIDPPGFALESFNPIGGFREFYRTRGSGEKLDLTVRGRKVVYRKGLPVDPSGMTVDGFRFEGFREFRDHVAENEDQIAKVLATKLLTFATGREMGFSDRAAIDQIVSQSKSRGHRIAELIKLVVQSPLFRRK